MFNPTNQDGLIFNTVTMDNISFYASEIALGR